MPSEAIVPPSRGSAGRRFTRPITGPAHQMAYRAGDAVTESSESGFAPMANSRTRPTRISMAGPATAIRARSHRASGRAGM